MADAQRESQTTHDPVHLRPPVEDGEGPLDELRDSEERDTELEVGEIAVALGWECRVGDDARGDLVRMSDGHGWLPAGGEGWREAEKVRVSDETNDSRSR